MDFTTADLCDEFAPLVHIAEPLLRDYGGVKSFYGQIETVNVFEDNTLVRQKVETAGEGRVLVVDGGGSLRCALVGDQVAQLAYQNGWAGLVINGCIRDAAEIAKIPLGVKALNTMPKRSAKKGFGDYNAPLRFAGVVFNPGDYLYADLDGIIVASQNLLQP